MRHLIITSCNKTDMMMSVVPANYGMVTGLHCYALVSE